LCAVLAMAGCAERADTDTETAPPVAPEAAVEAPLVESPPAPPSPPTPALPPPPAPAPFSGEDERDEQDEARDDRPYTAAQVTSMANAESYQVRGAYDLEGTIKKVPDERLWLFRGQFTFPTGGHSLGSPYLSVDGQRVAQPETALQDYEGTITLVIPVTPPAPDMMVTQALVEAPVALEIPAGEAVNFEVRVTGSDDQQPGARVP